MGVLVYIFWIFGTSSALVYFWFGGGLFSVRVELKLDNFVFLKLVVWGYDIDSERKEVLK